MVTERVGGDALRVCMVTGFRPTPGGGGMEKHVYELVTGLLDRGLDVQIICEDRSFLPDPDNALRDRILGIPARPLPAEGWVEYYHDKVRRLAELFVPERYDIVHCHSHYGHDIALRLSEPPRNPGLVTTYHLTPLGQLERFRQLGIPEPEGAPIDRAVAQMEATSGRLSDRCIAVSHGVGDEITRFYGVPGERVCVIHNWYDDRYFEVSARPRAREILGLDPQGRYLLYIGHFRLHRGRLMADVMRRLPEDISLLVVHPEPDEAIEAEFGDRVRFVGYRPAHELALYYAASDLQCFPTVYSGFGLALVEGMACGGPPVVFNFSAMNEIVTPESGYLVDDATPEAYATAILQGLADGGAKCEAATRRSHDFCMDPQIDRVVELYTEVLAERAAGPAASGRRRG